MIQSRFSKLLWLLGLAVVFYVACNPNPPAATHLINDKLAHFLVFLIIGFSGQVIWKSNQVNFKLLWFLASYGAAIEIVQHYVPGRFFSVLDWLMDILGLIVAVLMFKLTHRK
jgi:VanZ family protein